MLLSAFVTASAVAAPAAESIARGRAIFDQKGCQHCHSYVARRVGPSVRELMRDFIGEPVKTAKGINSVREHQYELRSGKISTADIRLISEWLAADFWPDDEADESAESRVASRVPVAPVTPVAPVAKAAAAEPTVTPAAVVPAVQKPAAPVATLPQAAPAAAVSGPAVKAIRLQREKGGVDRLLIELAGEPDEIDLQTVNGQLVVKFDGARLADSAPRVLTAGESATVVGAVRASSEQRSVELTVVPRIANWTYTAVQGRARLTIDLTATAPQSKAVAAAGKPAAKTAAEGRTVKSDKVVATGKAAATAAAKAPAATAASTVATVAATSAIAAGAAAAIKPEAKPEAKAPVAIARAEPDAATQARRDAEATRARQEAAKAAEEAAAQATLKREAEARAKREAEAQAKAKRDAEALASAKRDAAVDTSWQAAEGQAAGKKVRKGSNKPYKEPKLDPCPPASPADQVIGVVDVEQAKEIIDRIGCPQCHAYVQKKTGPPFKEVLKKYSGDPACVIHRLKTNETHKDEGVTKDIRPHEFKILADYVATRMKKD